MTEPSCSNCRFYLLADKIHFADGKDLEASHGTCRRYPPFTMENRVGINPRVLEEDYCGEH